MESDLKVLIDTVENLLNKNASLIQENERLMRENFQSEQIINNLTFLIGDLKNDLLQDNRK